MASGNVIDIRLIDATAGTVPGQAPGQPAGAPSNLPPMSNPAGAPPTPPTASGGGTGGATPSGRANSPLSIGDIPGLLRLSNTANLAAIALHAVSIQMAQVAYSMQKATEASVARVRNDEDAARRAEIEERFNRWASNAKTGMMIGGAIAGSAAGPVGTIAGGIIGRLAGEGVAIGIERVRDIRLAEFDMYAKHKDALRSRGRELAQYDQRLAMSFATGDVNRMRRDVGEAAIIGGAMTEVENKQQQLDRLDQQLGVLNKMKESSLQLERINKEMVDRQEALEEAMKDLPEEMKKKLRELGEGVKDPFTQLEERGGFAGDAAQMAANERGMMDQARRARLGFPLLLGVQ